MVDCAPPSVTKFIVTVSGCAALVLATATEVTLPCVLSNGIRKLLPDKDEIDEPCESRGLPMLNWKIDVRPIGPLVATSAQPCSSVEEVPGLCAKNDAPGARVPDKTPGAWFRIGNGMAAPLSAQNRKVYVTGT